MNWRERAALVYRKGILAEDDRGDLWCPQRRLGIVRINGRRHLAWRRDAYWNRRFDPRRPTHWRHWLRARLTKQLAMIELGEC